MSIKYQNIWGQLRKLAPDRKELPGTKEIRGIVVQQGINPKTVTVRAWWKVWQRRYRCYYKHGRNYQVHDDAEVARLTDEVVIRSSPGISITKHYYIKYIVTPGPRYDYWDKLSVEERTGLKSKVYETTPETTMDINGFRVKALKDRLINIRKSGIFESIDLKKK